MSATARTATAAVELHDAAVSRGGREVFHGVTLRIAATLPLARAAEGFEIDVTTAGKVLLVPGR